MNVIKTLFVVAAISVSSLALAEGGSERVIARMQQVNETSQTAVQLVSQRKVDAPVAVSNVKESGHTNC